MVLDLHHKYRIDGLNKAIEPGFLLIVLAILLGVIGGFTFRLPDLSGKFFPALINNFSSGIFLFAGCVLTFILLLILSSSLFGAVLIPLLDFISGLLISCVSGTIIPAGNSILLTRFIIYFVFYFSLIVFSAKSMSISRIVALKVSENKSDYRHLLSSWAMLAVAIAVISAIYYFLIKALF